MGFVSKIANNRSMMDNFVSFTLSSFLPSLLSPWLLVVRFALSSGLYRFSASDIASRNPRTSITTSSLQQRNTASLSLSPLLTFSLSVCSSVRPFSPQDTAGCWSIFSCKRDNDARQPSIFALTMLAWPLINVVNLFFRSLPLFGFSLRHGLVTIQRYVCRSWAPVHLFKANRGSQLSTM